MNLQTKRINDANASVSAELAFADMDNRLNKIATKIAKTVRLDGFRKGKVPLNVIKARYKENIEQDAQKEAVEEILQLGLKELGITPKDVIGDPVVTKFDRKNDAIDLEIKISLNPDFKLDAVALCVPEVNLKKIAEKEIEKRLEEIAKNKAPLIEAPKDKKLSKGDVAVIDFEGFREGKAFEGGKAENFELEIGSGRFIAGFEDALSGMKSGEEKEIEVKFPESYQSAELAGKPATFKVKLHKIRLKEPPEINEEFAKSLLPGEQNPSLPMLKEKIREQLESEAKIKLYNEELKEKLIQNLDEKFDFDLPELIIEQETDLLFRNSLNALGPKELQELKSDVQKAKDKRESFREEAKKSVKITFIINALSKRDNITVEDNEVLQTLYYEAMMSNQDPKSHIERYQQSNLLPAVKMAMIEDKILGFLLDEKLRQSTPEKTAGTKKPDKNDKISVALKPEAEKTAPKTAKKPKSKAE